MQTTSANSKTDEFVTLKNDVNSIYSPSTTLSSTAPFLFMDANDSIVDLLPAEQQIYPIEFDDTLDVLVIYSPQLAELSLQRNRDAMSDLFSGIETAQAALDNSGVRGKYRIVDIIERSAFEDELLQADSNSREVIIEQNTQSDIQFVYQQSGADFILNVANTAKSLGGFANSANFIELEGENQNQLVASFPLFASNAVLHTSLVDQTIAHEFGHTFGLQHDRESLILEGFELVDNHIPYGYVDPSRTLGTIMGATPCRTNGCFQTVYSSPDTIIDGIVLGLDESNANAANSARVVRDSFQHSAYFNSRFQGANVLWQSNENGIVVDWPQVIGADHYLIVPQSCASFNAGFLIELLDGASRVTTSAALIENLQHDMSICIIAERSATDNQGASRMLLGGTDLHVSSEHIKLDASLVRIDQATSNVTVNLILTNPNISNSSLVLSMFYFDQIDTNVQWFDTENSRTQQMENVLSSVLDYSFTGQGSNRSLSMTFNAPLEQINEAFLELGPAPQYLTPLRLRVGYLNAQAEPISAEFALTNSLPELDKAKLLTIPKRIENQTSTEIGFGIDHVSPGTVITLLPDDGLIIEDESYQFVEQADKGRVEAVVVARTESNQEQNLGIAIMLDGVLMDDKISIISGPVNLVPELALSVNSPLTAGQNVSIGSDAVDLDGSIEQYLWSRVSGPFIGNAQLDEPTLTIATASAGQYSVRLTVLDDAGSVTSQTIDFSVSAASAPQEPEQGSGGSGSGSGGALSMFVLLFLVLIAGTRIEYRLKG